MTTEFALNPVVDSRLKHAKCLLSYPVLCHITFYVSHLANLFWYASFSRFLQYTISMFYFVSPVVTTHCKWHNWPDKWFTHGIVVQQVAELPHSSRVPGSILIPSSMKFGNPKCSFPGISSGSTTTHGQDKMVNADKCHNLNIISMWVQKYCSYKWAGNN